MSPAANGVNETGYPAIFTDPSFVNKQLKVFWIGVGKTTRSWAPA